MYNKLSIFIILSTSFLAIFYYSSCRNHNVKFENKVIPEPGIVQLIIEPEFDQYLHNQDVYLKVSIVNKSQTSYYLKEPLIWYSFNFDIKSTKDEKLTSGTTIDAMPSTDSVEIPPDSVLSTIVNMGWFFNKLSLKDSDKNEVYSINGRYQGLSSNEILIEFIPPSDKELRFYKSMVPNDYDELENSLNVLDENDSRYTPQIYNDLLVSTAVHSDSIQFFNVFNKFLTSGRNSYSFYNALILFKNFTLKQLKWRPERIQSELDNLQNNYSGDEFMSTIKIFKRMFDSEVKVFRKLKMQY